MASPGPVNDGPGKTPSLLPGPTSETPGMNVCDWCRCQLPATAKPRQRFCSQRCRQFAFRLRLRVAQDLSDAEPARFAYADPPYPGLAKKYYSKEASFGGEVDHGALIASLTSASYAGWALSTSAAGLVHVLPLCPPGARVCAWVKPIGANPRTIGLHNCWEPLIVVGGRQRRPGKRDWLSAMPARKGGKLMGRKPIAFAAFLFQALGMVPGDTLDDLFPGTGVIGRAWQEVSASPACRSDADRLTEPSSTPAFPLFPDD